MRAPHLGLLALLLGALVGALAAPAQPPAASEEPVVDAALPPALAAFREEAGPAPQPVVVFAASRNSEGPLGDADGADVFLVREGEAAFTFRIGYEPASRNMSADDNGSAPPIRIFDPRGANVLACEASCEGSVDDPAPGLWSITFSGARRTSVEILKAPEPPGEEETVYFRRNALLARPMDQFGVDPGMASLSLAGGLDPLDLGDGLVPVVRFVDPAGYAYACSARCVFEIADPPAGVWRVHYLGGAATWAGALQRSA